MIPTDYNYKAKQFIRSVINQRQRLINMNKSYKNRALMMKHIDKLRLQLSAYPYTTDKAISNFMISYRDEITSLIPGGKKHQARREKFQALLSCAYKIIHSTKAGCSAITEGV